MPSNVNLTQRLQNLMPEFYGAKVNPNWIGMLTAIGESDQNTANLIASIAEQFFVSTASRPYLDRLGSNVGVQRPHLVGMQDDTFRQYIPILSYKPKQVKAIMDSLLDLFFFKESTTAYMVSTQSSPFALQDGWELEYKVDNIHDEFIVFHTADFANISAATAQEVVSAINRQAQFSFAVVNSNVVTGVVAVEIFTKTIGSKGSLQIVGGRADIVLQFPGFSVASGNGTNTQWTVTKVGDLVTFQWTGGETPNVNLLQVGNIVIISNPSSLGAGNVGWFPIESVNIENNEFSFRNILGTPGIFTELTANDLKFTANQKFQVFLNEQRAVVWQVEPDQVVVEMPTSPPVVKRFLQGSAHLNGREATMVSYNSPTSATMDSLAHWPATGNFFLQEEEQLLVQLPSGVQTIDMNTRLQYSLVEYTYASISGNTMNGITPNLPALASLNEYTLNSLSRNNSNLATAVTSVPNDYVVGDYAIITNATFDPTLNGTWLITNIVNPTTFQFGTIGLPSSGTVGTSRVEEIGMAPSGSLFILNTAQTNTGILGPYVWDESAPFVLSSLTADIEQMVNAGDIVRTLQISTNNIPNAQGLVIFDYGTSSQEGPIRYLYKPTANSLAIDPSYIFQFNHYVGSSVTLIDNLGPHIINGTEYAPYITDPSVARTDLEQLIESVASVGIFVDFLVRYPQQYYSEFNVYNNPNFIPQ